MNVAIYCRVSTLEQKEHGYSIEEQERKLKSFCEINDWNVADVFVDAGFSGAKRDRPELQRLMNDIKRFDLILVYKLDRLTRNVRDLLDLLEIFEQNNVAFRSATEVYDTSTAMGRLFVTLLNGNVKQLENVHKWVNLQRLKRVSCLLLHRFIMIVSIISLCLISIRKLCYLPMRRR